MIAKAVIGANFGDEGKGLITDYLAHKFNADIVVRFNGGAQAGHTVVTPSGQRHVFSHFSSGSFVGAATYLSKFFVVNPILFFKEAEKLKALGLNPRVMIDHRCQITTPYDMLLNQMVENHRGDKRHGSCGVGFGETIQRNLNPDFALRFEHLHLPAALRYRLDLIRKEYFPTRCKELGIESTKRELDLVNDPNLFSRFIEDCRMMFDRCEYAHFNVLLRAKQVVFEGAQGLLLDQDYGEFPHVTRSNTGLKNVVEICEENYLKELDVTYVTRCYLTRHGAGPLEGEVNELPFVNVVDETNRPNQYQGSLRFADLYVSRLKESIDFDLKYGHKFLICPSIAITCLDQFLNPIWANQCASYVRKVLGFGEHFQSFGPTRDTIR